MAKALFGHVGTAADTRLAAECRRLRLRVAELEAELARVADDRDALLAASEGRFGDFKDDLLVLTEEPALT